MFGRISIHRLNRAFNRARQDLADVGLLGEGKYLDYIDCYLATLPAFAGELGYVYDRGVSGFSSWLGFEPGVIYIPFNASPDLYAPGGTLLDTLRHEFAHAWAWLDPEFIAGRWFSRAFGAEYDDEWDDGPEFDPQEFVSSYATTAPREDFAETFMIYLKYRRSLQRFQSRPALASKMRAVENAVGKAARERAPHICVVEAD